MINVPKLTEELLLAGIPIHGCNSSGLIQFKDEATPAQIAAGEAILAAHDPLALTVEESEQVIDQTQLADLLARKQELLDDIDAALVTLQTVIDVTTLAQANTVFNQIRLGMIELFQIERTLVNVSARLARRIINS